MAYQNIFFENHTVGFGANGFNGHNGSPYKREMKDGIEVFSTCPQFADFKEDYLEQVRKVAIWSERCGCKGILIYADNRQVDPWVVAQVILESTKKLCPLIAIQPVYMHPYTVAKKLVTLGKLYNRRIYLNLVAGGFKNDLTAMNDDTPHDQRYTRLVEYAAIISGLMEGRKPVTFNGEYYKVKNLALTPEPDPALFPGIFLSGSSQEGLNAAAEIKATAIQYPLPSTEYAGPLNPGSLSYGLRAGIIARIQGRDAWMAGYKRFPENRAGEMAHQLALKTTDSQWYKKLAAVNIPVKDRDVGTQDDAGPGADSTGPQHDPKYSDDTFDEDRHTSPYWLHPFKTYGSMCPYLVGSYETVAHELAHYMEIGYRTFILDIPQEENDLLHTQRAFRLAKNEVMA